MALQVKLPLYVESEATKLSLVESVYALLQAEYNTKRQARELGTLTPTQWGTYLSDVFEPRFEALSRLKSTAKTEARQTDFHSSQGVTLKNVFEEI